MSVTLCFWRIFAYLHMIKIENYFCGIETCMLLCFKNNLLACEALMQFTEPNNDRMSVTVFFWHLKMPSVLKLLKFWNFSQEGNVLHTSTYISHVHFNAICTCLLTCLGCLRRRTRSITNEWSPGWSILCCYHGITQDIWVSLMIWSAQRSGGRPLGRRHDVGGVEARMSMAWVPGCRRQMCPKALRRSLRIVVVKGGCPVRISIDAFVT